MRNLRIVILGAVLCAGSFGATVAFAQGLTQQQPPLPPTTGGAGVRLDPFVVYPSAQLAEGYNDNVTLANSGQIRSAVTILSPALLAELKGDATAYRLGYTGTYGRYASSSADNFDYHELRSGADFAFSERSRLNLIGNYYLRSDPRGSTIASTGVSDPNKYRQGEVGGLYSYGAAGAQGRIELESLYIDKRYMNNFAATDTLDFRSYKYGGTFYWRIGPKTEWLFQGTDIKTDYVSPASPLDNTEHRLLTGLKWEATAATTGFFKIGESEKKFTAPGLPEAKGFIWEGSIRWSPLTYSTVDLITGKNYNDAQGGPGASAVTDEYYRVVWNHAWTERIRSIVNGSYTTDDYTGLGRNDKTYILGGKLTYDMRRWLTLGAEYTYSERDSNQGVFDYKKNLILFSLRATL